MPATAAYIAVQDPSTILDHGGDIDHTFALFDAPNVNVNRRPILSFRLNPEVGDGNVSLQMTLNQTVVVEQSFSSSEARTWQEVIESNILEAEDNELTARLVDQDGAGGIILSDVVVTYTNV